jgi:hypothetical protein
MEVFIYKLQGNEYRLTPFKIKKTNVCDLAESDVYVWPSIVAQTELHKTCPYEKVKEILLQNLNPDSVLRFFQRKYRVNYIPDFSMIPPNFEGKYKLQMNYMLGEEVTDQVNYILTISKYNTV